MAFKSLEVRNAGFGQLRAIEIGVTSRCNFRCSYCGAYDLLERKILSAGDVARVVDQLPDLERVKLSGGEVLLEFGICEAIVRYCTSRGIQTQINSNGTVLDEEKFQRLEDAGLGVLHFSLNHTDAASHAAFYRVTEKMFPKITAAITRAAASPTVETVAETILFNETCATMTEINHFAADLGVRNHEIQMEIPGIHQGYENTLNAEIMLESIGRLCAARDPRTTLFFSCLSAHFRAQSPAWDRLAPLLRTPGVRHASCIEGKAQLHLHSNGDVMICELGNPEVIGNVFGTDLLTIYTRSPQLRAFIQHKHEEASFSCFRHFDKPGQRPGNPGGGVPLPLPLPLPAQRRGAELGDA